MKCNVTDLTSTCSFNIITMYILYLAESGRGNNQILDSFQIKISFKSEYES